MRNIVLFPFAFIWKLITSFRNYLYDKGIFKVKSFDMPVICIGNISVGGTGKTPHAEYIIRMLKDTYRLAVLSRGYGRKTSGFRIVLSNSNALDVGDEALQIKQKFGDDITVAVSEDRVGGINQLLQNKDIEVILLDDGFQHRALKAGLNIVLTTAQNPFVYDYLLPYGRLREARQSVKRADIVIITKIDDSITEQAKEELKSKISAYNTDLSVFFSSFDYYAPIPLFNTKKGQNLNNIKRVIAFCGIANPETFIKYLKSKFPDVTLIQFNDHHQYSSKNIEKIINTFEQELVKDATIVITTEKDIVKLKQDPVLTLLLTKLPIYCLPIKVKAENDNLLKNKILDYVRENKRNC